nr:MAG TPA: hypothetical protein [Caudoviricetes sp.]
MELLLPKRLQLRWVRNCLALLLLDFLIKR